MRDQMALMLAVLVGIGAALLSAKKAPSQAQQIGWMEIHGIEASFRSSGRGST